jgi:hypothetical protein
VDQPVEVSLIPAYLLSPLPTLDRLTLIIWTPIIRRTISGNQMQPHKSEKLIQKINRAFLPYEAKRIYLFGSLARGEADALSDVNRVVIKRTTEPFRDRLCRKERFHLANPALRRS